LPQCMEQITLAEANDDNERRYRTLRQRGLQPAPRLFCLGGKRRGSAVLRDGWRKVARNSRRGGQQDCLVPRRHAWAGAICIPGVPTDVDPVLSIVSSTQSGHVEPSFGAVQD